MISAVCLCPVAYNHMLQVNSNESEARDSVLDYNLSPMLRRYRT